MVEGGIHFKSCEFTKKLPDNLSNYIYIYKLDRYALFTCVELYKKGVYIVLNISQMWGSEINNSARQTFNLSSATPDIEALSFETSPTPCRKNILYILFIHIYAYDMHM